VKRATWMNSRWSTPLLCATSTPSWSTSCTRPTRRSFIPSLRVVATSLVVAMRISTTLMELLMMSLSPTKGNISARGRREGGRYDETPLIETLWAGQTMSIWVGVRGGPALEPQTTSPPPALCRQRSDRHWRGPPPPLRRVFWPRRNHRGTPLWLWAQSTALQDRNQRLLPIQRSSGRPPGHSRIYGPIIRVLTRAASSRPLRVPPQRGRRGHRSGFKRNPTPPLLLLKHQPHRCCGSYPRALSR
jgi:hypothetical protein